MAKRIRSTSAETMVKAMLNAAEKPLKPPKHVHLRAADLPFWDGILLARARDEWTEADLVVGAQLARCQADIEVESAALDTESSVIENARGTQVMNPRVTVLEALCRREMALMRTLRMGGRIAGDARDELPRRALERKARASQAELADEELLAL